MLEIGQLLNCQGMVMFVSPRPEHHKNFHLLGMLGTHACIKKLGGGELSSWASRAMVLFLNFLRPNWTFVNYIVQFYSDVNFRSLCPNVVLIHMTQFFNLSYRCQRFSRQV